ncbi:hypothetical protein E2562_013226 [Oryza meyeriana var. granulata]|uniref:Uncharacterized protein n=1 Tax=Oryza meyeriana var. granulata TaxID=110450 RepID=A0A6G1D2B1_9ORYZ|nr:hypothetical protein E2562_013226 [Oryza meyeriana var. granulata]
MAIIFMVALNVVGMAIASWAWHSVQWRLMGLQHHDPGKELRLVVGLHGPQDVPMLAFLMEERQQWRARSPSALSTWCS